MPGTPKGFRYLRCLLAPPSAAPERTVAEASGRFESQLAMARSRSTVVAARPKPRDRCSSAGVPPRCEHRDDEIPELRLPRPRSK